MTPEEIRNTTLKAIYSQEVLLDTLVLKGGNALRLHEITSRESQDLDFSVAESIRLTKENEGKILENAISESFLEKGYFVNSFIFDDKPKKRKDSLPPFWGGYSISFSILDKEIYKEKIEKYKSNPSNLNKYAESLSDGSKKIEIDISYDEFIQEKVPMNLEGTTIFLYSPLMIVYEKIRASCQQLDDYKLTSPKTRARDLYDIYKTLTNPKQVELRSEILNQKNLYIFESIFKAKDVPYSLLLKLEQKREELEEDYNVRVRPQIPNNEDDVDFDYLFEYNLELFNELFSLVNNQY